MARPTQQPPRSKIAAARLEADLSQRELGELTGIPLRTIQRLDWNEIDNPPIGWLVNVATVLEVELLDICEPRWLEWMVLDPSAPAPPPKGVRRSTTS